MPEELSREPITLTEAVQALAPGSTWTTGANVQLDSNASGTAYILLPDADGDAQIVGTLTAGQSLPMPLTQGDSFRSEQTDLGRYTVKTDAAGAAASDKLYVSYFP